MNRNFLICASMSGTIVAGLGLYFLLRSNNFVSAKPTYKTLSQAADFRSNRIPYTDIKCLAAFAEGAEGPIKAAYLIEEKKHISPKGVPYRDLLVAVEVSEPGNTYYALAIVDYRKGNCSTYASGSAPEDPAALSRTFTPARAREIQVTWDKWRLKNIPNWRKTQQDYLNGKKVILTDEDVYSLKQLGYKLPKTWKQIK
jgi:hypothetical protein